MKKINNNQKVIGSLIGIDGNAFSLMAHFKKLARRQGLSDDWVKSVLKEAMKGDYDHLLNILNQNMEEK